MVENQNISPAARLTSFKWKKGSSGNPSGKRKGHVSLTAAIKRALLKDPDKVDAIAQTLIDGAIAGDVAMARLLLERLDGKGGSAFFNVHVDQSDRRAISVSPQVLAEIADSRKKYEAEKLCPPSAIT